MNPAVCDSEHHTRSPLSIFSGPLNDVHWSRPGEPSTPKTETSRSALLTRSVAAGDSDEEHLVHREVRELVHASTLKITRCGLLRNCANRTKSWPSVAASPRAKINDLAPWDGGPGFAAKLTGLATSAGPHGRERASGWKRACQPTRP